MTLPSIDFLEPVWCLLAVPLAVALWLWPMPSRILMVFRGLVWLLLVLGLAGLSLRLPSRAGVLVVVADRSLSMPVGAKDLQLEAIRLLNRDMPQGNRLAVVSFSESAVVEQAPQNVAFGGFLHDFSGSASRLDQALEKALAMIAPDTPGRILILSDGRWTGSDPIEMAARAGARSIGVDYRLQPRPISGDLAVDSVEAPSTVGPREGYMITAWIRCPVQQEVDYLLYRGQTVIARGRRQAPMGLSRLTFRDAVQSPGTIDYTLSIQSADALRDPVPENNLAKILVGVEGPRPLVLVSTKPDPALGRLLTAGGLDMRVRRPDQMSWTLEELSGISAVIIEDVPAGLIGSQGMENLAAWVNHTGTGLMITGGRTSYGPGGYFKSALEPIMPVSMEMRREHRKNRVAIVVALDRSGSMAVPVAGGRIKMDLANLGAAQVVDMLTPMDELGVLAVDSQAHVIAKLQNVENPQALRNDILSIDSMGGGIFVYEALEHAANMLFSAQASTRHIILFADAADSEEPGDYKVLLKKCREAGITCSVIGLGTESDVDANLLKEIAALGEGRIFFTNQAEDLPRLFAQDTFVVARSTFIDEATPISITAQLGLLTGAVWPQPPPPLGGYNLTYLRPEAAMSMTTEDEYHAPVVASWPSGLGRVLCYTGEADGAFTGEIASWDRMGDFLTGLGRWTAGESGLLPDNMLLRQAIRDGVWRVELHLDPQRAKRSMDAIPSVTVLRASPGQKPAASTTGMQWMGPDLMGLEIPLDGAETAMATVQLKGSPAQALAPVTLPYSPEFKPPDENRGAGALERIAAASGGTQRISLPELWQDLPKRPLMVDLGSWLLSAAVFLLLFEVLQRRTAFLSLIGLGRFRRPQLQEVAPSLSPGSVVQPVQARPARVKSRNAPAPAAIPVELAQSQTPDPDSTPQPPAASGDILKAMDTAAQRARQWTHQHKDKEGKGNQNSSQNGA